MKIDLQELARLERNDYIRKYRAANREKVKVYNQRYWEKKARQRLEERGKSDGSDDR